MTNIVITAAKRTPVGSFLGSFATTPAHELGRIAILAALEQAKVAADEIDEVIFGQVLTAGQGQNPARQAAVNAGIAKEKQEKEAAKKNVSEGGVRGMGRGNVKGRDYDPDKMFSQMTRPKAYRPPWEKSKLDKAFDAAKAKQDFTGAIKKLPPGKKTPKAMVRPRDYMKPNQASKVGVTEQTSTHSATSLAQRSKRTKPFRAWEPPAHTDHSSLSGKNESLQRVADVKMVKVRLPDGKIVYRKQRSSAEVQHETYTGSEPTSSNKNDPSNRFVGTDSIVKNYASVTPGQNRSEEHTSELQSH